MPAFAPFFSRHLSPGWGWLAGLLLALGGSGCATPPPARSYVPTGDPVVDARARMELAPARDRVLWQYRTALAALRRGQPETAEEVLDAALARIQTIYGADRDARKSRRYFTAESKKTFLGEPYERVMAWYYRGLLYWMNGEVDNARACFLSAQFMDSDTVDRTYANDYALLDYLEAIATARLGGDGTDALHRAEAAARLARPPAQLPHHNVLFFAESGQGPGKYATGEYHEQLRFHPGSSRATQIRITVAGQTLLLDPWEDLSFQATTRGGRVMDHVLANKAVFKKATDAFGTAAIISGAIMAGQNDRQSGVDEAGAGLLIAGVLSKILSAATTPAADTRCWETLPQYLYFGTALLPSGTHSVTAEFLDAAHQVLPELSRDFQISVPPESSRADCLVFLSDQNQ